MPSNYILLQIINNLNDAGALGKLSPQLAKLYSDQDRKKMLVQ